MYEYACANCGHGDTLLEKFSAAKRKKCPACGTTRAFERQVSAAAFHLKGSGWYATDFRDGPKPDPATTATSEATADKKEKSTATTTTDNVTKSEKSEKATTTTAN